MAKRQERTSIAIGGAGTDLFVIVDGLKIAKRGHPGTPQAKTWVSLEPGFAVHDCLDEGGITVEFKGAKVQ